MSGALRRSVWLALLLCGAWDPVTREVREVQQGNRHYAAGDLAQAERRYRDAEKRLPREAGVHFDLGAALHKQALALAPGPRREQLFDAADKELRMALDAGDARLRASAHYNLGNTLYERGKPAEAIEEYKKSLKLDPTRDDARHNLELALRMVKPPPPQTQPQPQDKQQPKPQEQQQPQPQPQPQSQPEQPRPAPQPKQPETDEQQKPQPAEGKARDLSGEDVERKLRELERRSKDLQVQRAAERAQERRGDRPVKDY